MKTNDSVGDEPIRFSMDSHTTTSVERSFVERDLDCDFSKFDWSGHVWRARWIRAAGDEGAKPGVWAFRRLFRLDKAAEIVLQVTADQRYDLWVDGVWAGFGSERGLHNSWFYETYTARLQPGDHVIAARVWWTGRGTSLQHAGHATADRPGFLLHAVAPFDEVLDTGPDTWEARPLAGYSFYNPYDQVQGAYLAVGARTRLDGRLDDHSYETGEGDSWAPAVANGLQTRFRAAPNAVDDWHNLTPGTLPPMRQSHPTFGTVRFAAPVPADKAGEPGGDLAVHEEDPALGVVHEVHDALGGEVEEDGGHHGAGGVDGEVGLGPERGVVGAERDLVALGDAGGGEREARLLHGRGEFAESDAAAVEVAQGRVAPLLLDGFRQLLKIVFHEIPFWIPRGYRFWNARSMPYFVPVFQSYAAGPAILILTRQHRFFGACPVPSTWLLLCSRKRRNPPKSFEKLCITYSIYNKSSILYFCAQYVV